jgi:hypothetical protein
LESVARLFAPGAKKISPRSPVNAEYLIKKTVRSDSIFGRFRLIHCSSASLQQIHLERRHMDRAAAPRNEVDTRPKPASPSYFPAQN